MDVFEYVIDKLEDMISNEGEMLNAGSAADYSEYCASVGKSSGIKMAILVIEQAKETLAKDEDTESEGMIDV